MNFTSASDDFESIVQNHDDISLESVTIDETPIVDAPESEGNFTELKNEIGTNSEVSLEKNYVYVEGDVVSGIVLSNSVTIDGKGHTIDAKNIARILIIKGDNSPHIVLNNITFVNANTTGAGGVINLDTTNTVNLSIINCKFINNSAGKSGGAVYLKFNGEVNIENNYFINNSGVGCGALYANNLIKSFYNNYFINNCAINNAGAAQVGANTIVNKSTFINNSAKRNGGALYIGENKIKVYDSTFEGNTADHGGAIYSSSEKFEVNNCIFERNSATCIQSTNKETNNGGGAIFASGKNTKIINSKFNNNNATDSVGGAILITNSGTVSGSSFNNNLARYGGAVMVNGNDGNVIRCNFTDNKVKDITPLSQKDGPKGAGVYVHGNNVQISDCHFEKNTVIWDSSSQDHLGGGIYVTGNKAVISNSQFDLNNATYGGGIYVNDACQDVIIDKCNFTKNYAQNSGATGAAISSVGSNPTISNCIFTNNTSKSNAGALYIDLRNSNLAQSGKNTAHVYNCNFTGNSASKGAGGAIHLRDRNSKRFYVFIDNCLFNDNVAHKGGGISVNGLANISNCKFDGNNASFGSAILLSDKIGDNRLYNTLYLSNSVFGKNRADSSSLTVDVDKKLSYYPSNVTVKIVFAGWDNIANAIWNEKDTTWVFISNITYDAYVNGKLDTVTTPVGFVNPVDGADKTNAQDVLSQSSPISSELLGAFISQGENFKIWQDARENAQLLNVKIVNKETGNVVFEKQGVLTDICGDFPKLMQSLKPGNYTVTAEHEWDEYYTDAHATNDFEIIDLPIHKNTEDTEVDVGENVTYTITVENPANGHALTDIIVSENAPNGFVLLDYTSSWAKDGNKFYYSDILNPGSSVTLTLIYKATKVGTFKNTVHVSTNETLEKEVNSTNTTVHNPSIKVTKTVDESPIFVSEKASFVIEVENNGTRAVNNVYVIENFNSKLIYDSFSKIKGEWEFSNADGKYTFILQSLDVGEKASFRVFFNTNKAGTFENNVSAAFEEHAPVNASDKVKVEKIPTHISVDNITTKPGAKIDVHIRVTSDDGVPFNGNVTITFPDGTTQTVVIVNGKGTAKWNVPKDYKPGKYPDTVKFSGDDKYLPSQGTGTITIPKVPVDITVGNVSGKPGDKVTIPIKVVPEDGSKFTGKVTVKLPDGTKKVVKIVNGKGSVDWTIPKNYKGDYKVYVSFGGNDYYYASNGTGNVHVIVDEHVKVSAKVHKSNLESHPTGNPILVLLLVLSALVCIKRKH